MLDLDPDHVTLPAFLRWPGYSGTRLNTSGVSKKKTVGITFNDLLKLRNLDLTKEYWETCLQFFLVREMT